MIFLHQGEEIWSCKKNSGSIPSQGLCLFSFAAGGEENFIPTSSILIGAQIAAKEPSSKRAEMLAGVGIMKRDINRRARSGGVKKRERSGSGC